jgi:hypothetical protein
MKMSKNSNIQTLEQVKQWINRMHKIHLEKYEQACIYDDHAKAITNNGAVNVLEIQMIELGMADIMNERLKQVVKRRKERFKNVT